MDKESDTNKVNPALDKAEQLQFENASSVEMLQAINSLRLSIMELKLEIKEQKLSEGDDKNKKPKTLGSPLVIALITGIIGLIGAAVANILQRDSSLTLETKRFEFASQQEQQKNEATYQLEKQKFETALVLKAIETGNPKEAAINLQFLIDAKYIQDPGGQISKYIQNPEEGKSPVLPTPSSTVVQKGGGNDAESTLEIQSPWGEKIKVKRNQYGGVEFLEGWDKNNLIMVSIPQLKNIPGFHRNGEVKFNKIAAEALKAAWKEIEDLKLLDRVISWDGAYSPRTIRGSNIMLSKHAWGIAFDINIEYNMIGQAPAAVGEKGSVLELVPIFEKHGFVWGGNLSRRDGNHFEYKPK